jgi:lipopolysaccharide export system protein LptA
LARLFGGGLYALAALALFPVMAWAQQPPALIVHPTTQSPLLLAADKIWVSKKRNVVMASGNVVVTQTDARDLHCSRLIIRWRKPLAAHHNAIDRLECQPI